MEALSMVMRQRELGCVLWMTKGIVPKAGKYHQSKRVLDLCVYTSL